MTEMNRLQCKNCPCRYLDSNEYSWWWECNVTERLLARGDQSDYSNHGVPYRPLDTEVVCSLTDEELDQLLVMFQREMDER